MAGRHELIPVAYAQKISAIRGVEAVQARSWGYYFDVIGRANYTLMVPEGIELKDNEIVVGAGISRVRQVFRGNAMLLRTFDGRPISFLIKGVLSPESESAASDLMLISATGSRRLFGVPQTTPLI